MPLENTSESLTNALQFLILFKGTDRHKLFSSFSGEGLYRKVTRMVNALLKKQSSEAKIHLPYVNPDHSDTESQKRVISDKYEIVTSVKIKEAEFRYCLRPGITETLLPM
jgi:hypothetical protein